MEIITIIYRFMISAVTEVFKVFNFPAELNDIEINQHRDVNFNV